MSVFAISDLHLSTENISKSMAVFGNRWTDYADKIEKNWRAIVEPSDTVIIPGDITWASSLESALPDLKFLNSLPGKKIISKGNHDFWWATVTKLNAYFENNELDTLTILYNDAICVEDYIVTGTRGWFSEPSLQNTVQKTDYNKIVNRESVRLKLALEKAKALQADTDKEIIAFFHFPPVWNEFCDDEAVDALLACGVKKCYFGHIHGCYNVPDVSVYRGVKMHMISADYLNFIPKLI